MKIDAWVIALDETDHYTLLADAPLIKTIWGVYLFDRNQKTHLCELTPSYFLIHLYNQVVLIDDVDESRNEELYDEYDNCGGDDIYVHCNTIDKIVDNGNPNTSDHHGDVVVSYDDDDDYYDQMDSIREYYSGNCPF